MQVALLVGGSGTRLREQTEFTPKGLIPIGNTPMVVHIMRWYAKFGFKDFVLALGYKQQAFKEYFSHYDIINNDITIDVGCYRGLNHHEHVDKGWRVILSDTGENTLKGGRLKKIEKYIIGDTFFMTYGDAVSDVNINELLAFHQSHGKIVTITGVHPAPRFGEILHKDGHILSFSEKPQDEDCLVNGGFMVFDRRIFDYLTDDPWCDLEIGPFEFLANKGEMAVFHHRGFWGAMDTIKDMDALRQLWDSGEAKWKV